MLIAALARGSAVAYDSKNDRYLVVSSHGVLWGRLVDGSGAPIGGQIHIGGAVHAHFPRVAYSPDIAGGAGGFLVVWHESDTTPTSIHVRVVSSAGEVLTPDTLIEPATSFWEVGAAVSYSTVSKEFLVAWTTFSPKKTIRGVRISNAGTALGGSFPIVAHHDYADNANIAYNAIADEWLIVHAGWQGPDPGVAYTGSQRVKPGTGALIGSHFQFGHAAAVYITDVGYNPATNRYLAAWHTGIMLGQVLNADGSPTGSVIPLSSRYAAYDALSLARNAISGTYFAVSHDSGGTQDGGVEISQDGQPLTAGVQVTSIGGTGNFYPRLATSTVRPDWYVSAANVFTSTIGQRITTATVSTPGAPGPSPQPQPPPPSNTCTYSLSNSSASFGQFGGSGGFTLTASGSTCAWSASSNQGWLTVTGGTSSGTGSSTIAFSVAPNSVASPRAALITVAGKAFSVSQAARSIAVRSLDFSGDNQNDIVWQNAATGQLGIWRMRGTELLGGEMFTPGSVADSNWKIVGTIDSNGDGKRDLLWQHDSGLVAVWTMNGTTMVSGDLLSASTTADPRWRVVATGDLDLDGHEDILWQHQNGTVAVWYMRGLTMLSGEIITSLSDARWRVVGTGDFNQDGRLDLVWRHSATGEVALWYMNDRQQISGTTVDFWVADTNWEIVAVSDLNADGRPDFIWRNRTNGSLSGWIMADARLADGMALGSADVNWKVVGPK